MRALSLLSGPNDLRLASAVALLAFAAAASGCTPVIGDKCVLSTDCSTRGDRLCDTSQPDGYCTQFNCTTNSCPDHAACVLFNAAVPGCGYDDHSGNYGARTARAFCVGSCGRDSDCRAGYVCASPSDPPWNGMIRDDDQSKRTCLVAPEGYGVDGGAEAGALVSRAPPLVCAPTAPDVPAIEAGAPSVSTSPTALPPLVVDAGAPDASDGGDGGAGGDGG
jgi:hypothetical protein